MIARYDFAPLDGITKVVFRRVHHRMFGGPDRYFIPFFSPTDQHILTQRDRRELEAANNGPLPLVPQVMTRRAEDFLWAAEVVADLGYGEVNLNLGCPSGTVTAKGKGSGFLAHPEDLDRFFDQVFSSVKLPVSVKTRLGYETPEEFYRVLLAEKKIPTHAQLTPFMFEECYQQAYDEGYTHLIYTAINSKGSATYQNALQARDEFYEDHPEAKDAFRIYIIDSRTYTMSYGYPVVQGARMAADGAGAQAVADFIQDRVSRVRVLFSPLDLRFAK